jgi:hypothetical protein
MTAKTAQQTAQQTLADLKTKLRETEERALMREAERSSISYLALAEGDAKAIARLKELNAELASLDQDAAVAESAILEAERRVLEATRADEAKNAKWKATEARKFRERMIAAGNRADTALKDAFGELSEIYKCAASLNAICYPPNAQVVEVNLKRVLVAASLDSRFSLGALAPIDRHTAWELAKRWGEGIDSFAEQRLQEIEPKEKIEAEAAA